jgi:hypothetical protein
LAALTRRKRKQFRPESRRLKAEPGHTPEDEKAHRISPSLAKAPVKEVETDDPIYRSGQEATTGSYANWITNSSDDYASAVHRDAAG